MKKNKKGQYVINGKAMWAKVNGKINTYEGDEIGYAINLQVSDEDAKAVDKVARDMIVAAKNNPAWENSKKKVPTAWEGESTFAFLGDDGVTLSFRTNHKDKDGNRKYVKVFNKSGVLYEDYENILIGNGSDVVIIFTPNIYWLSKKNHGVSLRLEGIMVINMVSFGAVTADDFGVELENDFSGDEIPV